MKMRKNSLKKGKSQQNESIFFQKMEKLITNSYE